MGFGILAQDFNDTLSSFDSVFQSFGNPSGGIRTHSYVHKEGVTNRILPQNWKLNLPYSFRVVGVSSPFLGGKSPISGLVNLLGPSSGGGLFDEFILPINPSQITQDEVFSVQTIPTQKGVVTEHNGVIFKDLVISGTTGMRPDSSKSGYEYFQELRNYFRAYAEFKKDPNQKNAQLYFVNRKDNEWLIVEPVRFSMERSRGFLYSYKIVLKVIGTRGPIVAGGILGDFFNTIDNVINTATDYVLGVKNIFNNFQNTIKTFERDFTSIIMNPIDTITLSYKSFLGQPILYSDLPQSYVDGLSERTKIAIMDDAVLYKSQGKTAFLGIQFPTNNKTEVQNNGTAALDIIPYEARKEMPISFLTSDERKKLKEITVPAKSIPRKFYVDLREETIRLRDNASEKFGYDMTEYNTFTGRTNVFVVDEDREPNDDELQIIHGFQLLERGLNAVLASDVLFTTTYQDEMTDILNNFDDNMNLQTPFSADEIILPGNTTLEDLASEFLGDPTRWIEIALVNNLSFPYIDDNISSKTVKKPGDRILIPRPTVSEKSNIPQTRRYPATEKISETERNLGVDLKVNKEFDLIFNNANDFQLVSGSRNAAQAVILALALEKGGNKYHPEKGVGLRIGEKIRNGEDVRDDLFLSILSDPRFTNILDLTFIQKGSATHIAFKLAIKRLSTPIPVTLAV